MDQPEKSAIDSRVYFGACQLDVKNVQLWRDHQEVKLTGKAFAVLSYFVHHPGQLVTKDDLFAAAWPETVVSDATLASCIQEVRQALGDDAKAPRYIETVHRRGFRFIEKVVSGQQSVVSSEEVVSSQQSVVSRKEDQPTNREDGLASRVQSLERVMHFAPSALQLV